MIYVECNPDVLLVKSLGIARKDLTHSGDKGRVCRDLADDKGSRGLVDEDAVGTQPSYMSKMKVLGDKQDVKLMIDPDSGNWIIVLCPKHEDWILKAAKEAKVDVRDFRLPNDPDELHKTINVGLKNYEGFLKAIRDKSRRIALLKALLNGDATEMMKE